MRYLKVLLLLLCILGLVACSQGEQATYEFYSDFEYESSESLKRDLSNSVDKTDSEMNTYFQSAYGLQHLKTHSVHWDEKLSQVVMQFVFSSDAPLWQMKSAKDYGLDTLVFKQYLQLELQTYQMWAFSESIQHVYVEVYVEDALLAQDYYLMDGRFVKEEAHYEANKIVCEGQKYEPKDATWKEDVQKYLPENSEIEMRSNLREEKVIVAITSKAQVNPENLEDIQKELSSYINEEQELIIELYDEFELYYKY